MKTIYKYKIVPDDLGAIHFSTNIYLPADAKILTVQYQFGEPHIWVMLDTEEPKVSWKFTIIGTGQDMGEYLSKEDYIGTFQLDGGALVFHLFAKKND